MGSEMVRCVRRHVYRITARMIDRHTINLTDKSEQRRVRVHLAQGDAYLSSGEYIVSVKRLEYDGTETGAAFDVGALPPVDSVPSVLAGQRVLIVLTWDGVRVAVPVNDVAANIRCFQPIHLAAGSLGIRAGYWKRVAGAMSDRSLAPIDGATYSADPSNYLTFDVTSSPFLDATYYALVAFTQTDEDGAVEIDHDAESQLAYSFTTDFNTFIGGAGVGDSGTSDRWDNYRILFKFSVSSGDFTIDEIYHEGSIEDLMIVTDTDATDTMGVVYGRKTLDHVDDYPALKNAYELHNVDKCIKNSLSVPFFNATTDDTPRQGELLWAAVDSNEDMDGDYKSVEINGGAGTYYLGIYGFRDADDWTAAYKNASDEVAWQAPATFDGEHTPATSKSTIVHEVQASPNLGSTAPYGTIAMRVRERRITVANGAIDVNAGSYGPGEGELVYGGITSFTTSAIKHTDLNFTGSGENGGDNDDHDNHNCKQGGTYAYNSVQSIGYATGTRASIAPQSLRIDLQHNLLYDSTAPTPVGSIHATDRHLLDAGGVRVVDWNDKELVTTMGDSVLNWEDQQFLVPWTALDDFTVDGEFEVTDGDITISGAGKALRIDDGSIYLAAGYAINVGAFEGYTDTTTEWVFTDSDSNTKNFHIVGGVLAEVPAA